MMNRHEISDSTATLADIIAFISRYDVGYRSEFVNHFRINWFDRNGCDFNSIRIDAFIESHPLITKLELIVFLEKEALSMNRYWQSVIDECDDWED